jgi:nucleolar protein 58
VGQAPAKLKGKISRVLAAKAALGVRCDALCDVNDEGAMGIEARAKVSPFSPDEPSFLPPAAGRPL